MVSIEIDTDDESSAIYRTRRAWLFWLGMSLLFLLFLFSIRDILLPFVLGALIAYFLDPVADRLEKWGASRMMATSFIIITFFTLLTLMLVALVPVIIDQGTGLLRELPNTLTQLRSWLEPQVQKIMGSLDASQAQKVRETIKDLPDEAVDTLTSVAQKALSSGVALINLLSLLIIAPVVSFYLLRDWDKIIASINQLLPRNHAATIRTQARKIDETISGFVRGTLNVMLVLGTFYAIGLSIVGLNFGVLIGLLGGLAIIIPYIGTIITGILAIGFAFTQFDSWPPIISVMVIFAIGQIAEGNFLTPKLVGDKVGLHPLWLIFGMLAGGTLFGFVGIFLAVPVTAAIGVLVRFAVEQYINSRYYQTNEAPILITNDYGDA